MKFKIFIPLINRYRIITRQIKILALTDLTVKTKIVLINYPFLNQSHTKVGILILKRIQSQLKIIKLL